LININYDIADPQIEEVILRESDNSFLKKGDNFSVLNITNERERIYNILKNNGYFDFQRQYLNFRIDTTIKKNSVYLDLEIKNPSGRNHVQYTIEKINLMIDVEDPSLVDTIIYKGINYFYNPKSRYSKKILNDEIALEIGDNYSQDKARFTKNNLGNLDIIKFVNINFSKSDSARLSAYITIKTLKKYQINTELGGNLNVSSAQAIPGPFINFKVKDRKIFRGFESLELNSIASIQGQVNYAQPDRLYRSREIGSILTMSFPRLLIPRFIQEADFLQRQNPFKNNIYKKTRLNIGYNNLQREEFTRENFNFSVRYEWKKGINEKFNFSPLELLFVETKNKTQTT
jgi:hypothetical protein